MFHLRQPFPGSDFIWKKKNSDFDSLQHECLSHCYYCNASMDQCVTINKGKITYKLCILNVYFKLKVSAAKKQCALN